MMAEFRDVLVSVFSSGGQKIRLCVFSTKMKLTA